MKCSNCGKNNANVSYEQNINGEVTTLHLCENCAHKLGLFNSFDDIFSPMVLDLDYILPEEVKCRNCGYTLSKYKSTGLFGCDNCYDTFKKEIDSFLPKLQGKNRHIGSTPRRIGINNDITKNTVKGKKVKPKSELEELKEKLQKAIKEERFEDAVTLRDKIKEFEGGKE